ncbi:MAG: hypothetical protein ABH859_02750 [Pseudomonadota bacterium]
MNRILAILNQYLSVTNEASTQPPPPTGQEDANSSSQFINIDSWLEQDRGLDIVFLAAATRTPALSRAEINLLLSTASWATQEATILARDTEILAKELLENPDETSTLRMAQNLGTIRNHQVIIISLNARVSEILKTLRREISELNRPQTRSHCRTCGQNPLLGDRAYLNGVLGQVRRAGDGMRAGVNGFGNTVRELIKDGFSLDDDDDHNPPPAIGSSGRSAGGSLAPRGSGGSNFLARTNFRMPYLGHGIARFGGGAVNFGRNCLGYIFAAEALALAYTRFVAWPYVSAYTSQVALPWITNTASALQGGLGLIQAIGYSRATISVPIPIFGGLIHAILEDRQNELPSA